MDEDDAPVDFMAPELIEARDDMSRSIANYLKLARPEYNSPVVLAWVLGIEWTSTDLEQSGQAARLVIPHHDQTISSTIGLGHLIINNY